MGAAIPATHALPVLPLAGVLLLLASCASNPRLEQLLAAPAPPGGSIITDDPWPMHTVDNPNLRLPNGLESADADSDGRLDLLTNYEWDGFLRIAFGPPTDAIRQPWPAVTIGRIANAESSCFGDVDSDGDQDVVAVHGAEALGRPGLVVLLNPGGSRARDPRAWGTPIELPAAAGIGHLHYVRCADLDGDGRPEIVFGGRGNRHRPGLRFLSAPVPDGGFEPGGWTITSIDAEIESGHGFVFGDLDGDGDEDIALANSDWNTEPAEQMVAWYENPGPGHLGEAGTWVKRVLYEAPDFYTKEQLALADVDADGRADIVVHLENALYFFRNRGPAVGPADGERGDAAPVFERIVIPKPDEARWRSRMLRLADVDGDLRLEVVAALIHRSGSLPADRAAVFWMDVDWIDPARPAPTHSIKWGSGFRGTGPLHGEKWDQAVLADLDGDGDLDIAANCEEFHSGCTVHLAVVWFENPLGEDPG